MPKQGYNSLKLSHNIFMIMLYKLFAYEESKNNVDHGFSRLTYTDLVLSCMVTGSDSISYKEPSWD